MKRRIITVIGWFALALSVTCANETTGREVGAVCRLNADCGEALRCKFGECRKACERSSACGPGHRCVLVDQIGVCSKIDQLACAPGCKAPLSCGPDQQCRNSCDVSTPCGLGQICVPGTGTAPSVCADADETLTTGAGAARPAPAPAPSSCAATAGNACCEDQTCGAGLSCTKGGSRCTCAAGCAGSTVLRQDGTLLLKNGELVKGADGQPFKAPGALDLAASWSTEAHSQGGCVVRKDTTVWCWGQNGNGRLGAGLTDPSSETARQVITTAQMPLMGVRKIATYFSASTVCASDENGRVWCWGLGGRGQLGNGSVADSNVATQVLLSAGGEPLTEVLDVAVSFYLVCALKTNGTVWCWGSGLAPFPKLWIGQGAAGVACSIEFCCALSTAPGTVACWEGPAPVDSFYVATGPGTPLNGVDAIFTGRGDYLQALKSDLTMLEWNKTFMPAPVQDNGMIISAPHLLGSGCFVTKEGRHLPNSAIPICE